MARLSDKANGKRRFKNIFIFSVLILGLVGGLYITVTALSPALIQLPVIHRLFVPSQTTSKIVLDDRLFIPKIDVNVPIVEGDTEEALTRGAWHRMPENGNPQDGGNFVLSAHRFVMSWTPGQTVQRSPFYSIDKLDVGDTLEVHYHGSRYHYVISKKYKVSPSQTDIEKRTDEPKLTLYSCTLRGSADGRDVLEAHIVE